jgi:molecular chaperone DnaJ
MATDYYALLGVDRSATEDELKRAYRRLARQLHPDANGGDPEAEARFKEVTVAYETLRDPERRRRYDLFGPDAERAARDAGPMDGFAMDLGDLFGAFFGGGAPGTTGRSRGPRRGDDVEVVLDLRFEEAAFGARREVPLTLPATCPTCRGNGARPGTTPVSCPECRGSGQVRRVRQSFLGQVVTTLACSRCRGQGEVVASPCPDCRGEGRRALERTVTIEVPPGVDTGATLRVAGAGAAGPRGGPPGDLYVHLRVAPHPHFERSGADLLTTVHVGMAQAALGTEVPLETLDGTERLSVPEGTQSGTVIRLPGRGVPRLKGRGRGDLVVEVVVDTPTGCSPEEVELLRRLAELRGESVGSPTGGLFSRLRSTFSS